MLAKQAAYSCAAPLFCPTFLKVGKSSRQGTSNRAALPPGNAAKRQGFNLVCANYHLCALIRGLQNLETPCKGGRIVTFCGVQKVTQKARARTHKKLPVASFCASETAETGRIANGCEQGDHVSRSRQALRPRFKSSVDTLFLLKFPVFIM